LDVINELAISPDGNTVAVGRSNGELALLNRDTQTETILRSAGQDITNAVMVMGWQPGGNLLAIGYSGKVEIWNVDGQLVISLPRRFNGVVDIDWSTDSNHLLVADENQDIILWDVTTNNQIASMQLGTNLAADLHPDNTTVVVATLRGISIFDIITNTNIRFIETGNFEGPLAWNSTGEQILVYSEEIGLKGEQPTKLNIWDAKTGTLIHSLSTPEGIPLGAVLELGWSPDDSFVFSSTFNGFINVWDAATGTYIGSIERDIQIFALDITPDGSEFVFGGVPNNGQPGKVEIAPVPGLINYSPASRAIQTNRVNY
jgi:WD40 repeat protein